MTTALVKVEGAGNDFVLAMGAWVGRLAGDSGLVRRLCHRRLGIGADGVLLVEVEGADRVRLEHRNADGTPAPFCGNGTRCAARAAVDIAGCRSDVIVDTGWEPIAAMVREASVSLDLPAPTEGPRPLAVTLGDRRFDASFLEIGVPHLVVSVSDPNVVDLPTVGPLLRRHPELDPGGANVNFVSSGDEGPTVIRTWERGVEGETLSCGSGIVAAALVVMARRGADAVRLQPASGDVLVVEALGSPPRCSVRFTGPARIVAEIQPGEGWLRG
jgi:diaminopimelate epimerase